MFAIVEIAGQQFKVEKDQSIFVHRLQEKEGQKIILEKVLLIEDKGTALIGTPVVEGYQVKATVLAHVKGDKVLVFKKKRRKGYQKLNGHRQAFTEIHIDTIEKGKAPKKTTEKKETATEKAAAAKKPAATTKKTGSKTKETAQPAAKKTVAKTKTGEATSTTKTTKPKTSTAKKTTATSTKSTKTKAAAKPKTTAAKTGTKKTVAKKETGSKKEEK